MSNVEKLARDRTRIVLAMGIAFTLWQASHILTQLTDEGSAVFLSASVATIVGAVGYTITALLLFLYYRRVRITGVASTLTDDWNKLTTGLSLQYGFFFLMGATALLLGASMFWALPTTAALQTLLMIGVTGTLFAFTWLQTKGGNGE